MILRESDYYRGNKNLKTADVNIEYTQEQIDEYIKCSQDAAYFIKKYIKIITLDQGLVPFNLWPFQEKLIHLMHNNRFVIAKLLRQVGKALDIETPILTKNGFVLLKNLNVGDVIYGPNGKETKVTFITETMYNRPCYKITFSNGDSLIADEEHLWSVKKNYYKEPKVLTTKQLLEENKLNRDCRFFIEFTKPLEFEEKEQLIDPYLLGVWLGDGHKSGGAFTCHKDDLEFYSTQFNIGHTNNCKRNAISNARTNRVVDLHTNLRVLGLRNDKHIPLNYLTGSFEQRLALVQGLMDTDGYVSKQNGHCEFYQKKEALLNSVRTLLASLGIKTTKKFHYDNGEKYYTICFSTNLQIFRLPRKRQIHESFNNNHPKIKRLHIDNIEKIDSVPVRCLQVDNDDHLFLAGTELIPTHNTSTVLAYFVWLTLFTDSQNILIAANKRQVAEDILNKYKIAYENVPLWLQQGVIEWNKGTIELENGSKIRASSTTSGSARSGSYNIVLLDEFAHIQQNLANDFYTSVYPVITSGTTTKIFMISTPKGMNLFYNFWMDAVGKRNDYIPFEIHWRDVPGRDEKWYQETLKNIGEHRFKQEFECEFLGSADTLISGTKLQQLATASPKYIRNEVLIYDDPIKEKWDDEGNQLSIDHKYACLVDTAEGKKLDYSTFSIVDITQTPYKVVATYRNNIIAPILFPSVIYNTAKFYNDAYVLIEAQSVGIQVGEILASDLEYENIIRVSSGNKKAQEISAGHRPGSYIGVRMSMNVKKIGCTNLKTLIETNQLLLNDAETIFELSTFVQNRKGSYAAEEGSHDDMVMTLVLFGWMTTQHYFKELVNHDLRKQLKQQFLSFNDEEMLPEMKVDDGIIIPMEKNDGVYWSEVNNGRSGNWLDPYYEYMEDLKNSYNL